MGIAQLVEYLTEEPGARPDRFEALVQQEVFLPVSFQGTLTLSIQLACATTGINVCAHAQNPNPTGSNAIVWTPSQKYCLHRQEWVVLLLQLLRPYPGKATQISHKGQGSTCIPYVICGFITRA